MPEARYPDIRAGQDIDEEMLRSMLPRWVYKTAQTDRLSTITPTADPDLTIALEPGTYNVEMWLHYSTPAAADFRTDWNFTGTVSTSNKWCLGLGTTVSDSTPQGIMRSGIHGHATDVIYGDRGGANQMTCYEAGLVTVTVAGTLELRWAQGTSTASNTSLHGESRMRVEQIA